MNNHQDLVSNIILLMSYSVIVSSVASIYVKITMIVFPLNISTFNIIMSYNKFIRYIFVIIGIFSLAKIKILSEEGIPRSIFLNIVMIIITFWTLSVGGINKIYNTSVTVITIFLSLAYLLTLVAYTVRCVIYFRQ